MTSVPSPAAGQGPRADPPRLQDGLPAPLRLAAALVAAEGLVLSAYAVLEVASVRSGRVTMGLTTAFFFAVFAALLMVAARGLRLRRSWARGPAVFAQLLCLGVAWSFGGGGTTWVALLLAAVAVVVIGGVLAPSSIAALDGAGSAPADV